MTMSNISLHFFPSVLDSSESYRPGGDFLSAACWAGWAFLHATVTLLKCLFLGGRVAYRTTKTKTAKLKKDVYNFKKQGAGRQK